MKSLAYFVLMLLLFSCMSADSVRTHNRERLVQLSPGMSKQDVLATMGTRTMTTYDNR